MRNDPWSKPLQPHSHLETMILLERGIGSQCGRFFTRKGRGGCVSKYNAQTWDNNCENERNERDHEAMCGQGRLQNHGHREKSKWKYDEPEIQCVVSKMFDHHANECCITQITWKRKQII